jgi:hypothetical protein
MSDLHTDHTRGTILFAHGSRDPLWRKPIEAVASHIGLIAPAVQVRCAYLELMAPDLPASTAELAALPWGYLYYCGAHVFRRRPARARRSAANY